ncbi:aldehyde dehydrogenase (NADP(+)) [Caulobacter sp. CCG-8]|uniref:aldehyde dehydrogenase (NADP(+)) n=1 Tax=Caulobacter sp. CCG-8 TaxID=3127958 RepID=UPI00307EA2A3
MDLRGMMLIGGEAVAGGGETFRAFDPGRGERLEPAFASAGRDDVERACALAEAAFDAYRATPHAQRAAFLEGVAVNLAEQGSAIVERAMAETGLPRPRLEGELGRATGQLRLFAAVLRDGGFLDVRIDHALPGRAPPRADLRLTHLPLGPVAVFGASNFPLAFSVAGGDTASALAAGCPVVVKAHPAHPGTSELAGRAVAKAVAEASLPPGVFSLLFDSGHAVGSALVSDPRIQAVGFTGSRAGGLALMALAQARPRPIPVYAEMSSINPVILLPGALAARGEAIARSFVTALTLGAGQFCTNPGLLLAIEGPALDAFVAEAARCVAQADPATMLTPGIRQAFERGVAALERHPRVEVVARGRPGGEGTGGAVLLATTAEALLADSSLSHEVFGASSLLVRCPDIAALERVLEALEGQLAVAVHAAEADLAEAARLMPRLERLAGRILFDGFGTGVEVCDAMVHGGPFPATSDGRSTSVGSLAIARFLRPVCYQDVPAALLPPALRDYNPVDVPRRLDGRR